MTEHKRGFPQLNPAKGGRKSGAGTMAQTADIDLAPEQGYSDNFEVDGTKNRDQAAVNGEFGDGVKEGPVSAYSFSDNDKDDRDPPKKGDATPGGGW